MNFDKQKVFSRDYYYGRVHSNYLNYDKFDNDRYWKPVVDIIRKYHIHGRILDIGCAFAYFLKRAQPFFQEIYGVDISDYAISKAKSIIPSGYFRVLDLDKQELPFENSFFDFITAFDVLEHIESVSKSLQKILPKLKPDGYLMFSVPLKDSWAGKIFHFFDKDVSHISVPYTKELYSIIEHSGLKIIQKQAFLNAIFFRVPGVPQSLELLVQKI